MAPGQISRQYKPTGSVDGSSFRSQESRRSRQSDRLSRKAAPQDSNISTGDDGHEDIYATTSQNLHCVLNSSVKKINKKTTKKRPTKNASNTETVLRAHQMFINELFRTNDDPATVSNPVLSTSTADESEEPIQVATFDNTGIFLTPSHSNESYEAEDFYAAVDSQVLQLNPDHEFESPHPFANVLLQINDLNTYYEIASPAPFIHNQQFDLDLNTYSSSQPAHIQTIDRTLEFGSSASFPYFEESHPNSDIGLPNVFAPNHLNPGLEFGSPTPSPRDQQFNFAPEFDSPALSPHDRQFNPAPGPGSPASFRQFQQLQPSLDFGLLAGPAHVRNLDSAFEPGAPDNLEYAPHYNQRLDSEPPQSLEFIQLQKDIIESQKLPSTAQVPALDPRLQAKPLVDSQDWKYGSARNPRDQGYVRRSGSSLLIESTLAAKNAYHYSQRDMSVSSPEDLTKYALGSLSSAGFHQQFNNDDNGFHGDDICDTNGIQAVASSRLVNQPTYNGAGVYPAKINSRGIDMGLQPMAADYSNGLAENLRARRNQQDLAHDNYHANHSGLRNASSVNSTIQESIAPIPKRGTEAESEPTGSSIDRSMDVGCSVEAAQRGFWHEAMNRHGIYRPRGVVRVLPNELTQWREHARTCWFNAVKYEDIRGQLLVECAELGQYTYPREKGTAAEDITAFHPDQKDWAFEERHLRPDILHQYEKRGYQNPCYPVQIWLYHGAVVLDNKNLPILDFKNMPKAISSQVEGGLQEAIIRQDSRIEANDFRVRMLLDPKGRGVNSTPCLSAIGMRRSRFRWRAGYLSWTTRTGSDDLKKYLDSILPAHCKAANSTRDFRELKPSEVKRMTLESRGKYLARAGKRLLSPAARERSEKTFREGLRKAEIKDGVSVRESGGEDEE